MLFCTDAGSVSWIRVRKYLKAVSFPVQSTQGGIEELKGRSNLLVWLAGEGKRTKNFNSRDYHDITDKLVWEDLHFTHLFSVVGNLPFLLDQFCHSR